MLRDWAKTVRFWPMVRFGGKGGSSGTPEEPADWRDWSRDSDETRFDEDLALVDTDVEDFGDSGATGFSDAWSESANGEAPLPEEAEGDRAERLRNMDRKVSAPRIAAALVLVAVAAGAVFAFQQLTVDESQAADSFNESPLLVAPGEPRDYIDDASPLRLTDSWTLGETFLASTENTPEPIDAADAELPAGAVAAPLMWGGRVHIAVIGEGVGAVDLCVVASLFTADLEVVDIAGDGACEGRFSATGDRLACRSENLVLLEVWPEDPGVSSEQPDATRVRVRIERTRPDGSLESVRSIQDLSQPVDTALQVLGGTPETTAEIRTDGPSGSCGLLDRSDVTVQLL